MNLLIAYGLMVAGGLVVAFVAAWRAPLGYEDETGFHLGNELPGQEPVKDFNGVVIPALAH